MPTPPPPVGGRADAPPRPAGGEQLERPLGVREREPVGDELRRSYLALGDQRQERVHVALLGPADVADRIVDPVQLVARVVAARPVRARQAEVELLRVEGTAI